MMKLFAACLAGSGNHAAVSVAIIMFPMCKVRKLERNTMFAT